MFHFKLSGMFVRVSLINHIWDTHKNVREWKEDETKGTKSWKNNITF